MPKEANRAGPVTLNEEALPPIFTRQQILAGRTMGYPQDVLAAVLVEGKTYTKEEAGKLASSYLERKV